jgi:uncharacterized protein YdbL (DUF1318 family)
MKANYMILQVGTNPIPNLISCLALACDDAKIYLISTENNKSSIGTSIIAENLKKKLLEKRPKLTIKIIICDKSNRNKITKTANKIYDEIFKEDIDAEKNNVILDYTGGTKCMAAYFYDLLKEREKKEPSYNIAYSYVDSDLEKIIIEKVEISSLAIEDVANENNITIDDIVEAQGYKIIKREVNEANRTGNVLVKNDNNNKIEFDDLLIKNFKLLCIKKSNKSKKSECKMELFHAKDNCIKIGGDQAALYFVCNCKDEDVRMLENDIKELKKSYTKITNSFKYNDLENIINGEM